MGSSSVALFGLVLLTGLAPFQCGGSDPDEPSRLEDSPGDALYRLAGDFEKAGDEAGQVRVLRFLIARYPKNRHAATAREDLKRLGEPIQASGETPSLPPPAP
jgi:hypothetical protein